MTWPLLESLDDAERRRILGVARRRRFGRGEVVFHEGDPGDTVHLVDKGHFSVRITTPLGEVATVRVHGPGGWFGELAVLSPAPRVATVIAVDRAETLALSAAAIADLRGQSAGVDQVLMQAMIAEVRRLSGALVEALYLPAQTRVVLRLLDLAEVFGASAGRVVVPLTQEELAHMAGTTRPTANRVVGALEQAGVLRVARGRIEIQDLDALAGRAR